MTLASVTLAPVALASVTLAEPCPAHYLMYQQSKSYSGMDQRLTLNSVRWCTPVTTALGRLRQQNHEFRSRLGYKAYCRPAWAVW